MRRNSTRLQRGFTLIEVMVVVVILAILAAVVVPRIMSRPEQARKVKARTDVMALDNALEMYKLDNGFYPSTEQGLNALVKRPVGEPQPDAWQTGGYLKNLPRDPWGQTYHYSNPGKHGEVDVWTHSPSDPAGVLIGNWSLNQVK